MSAFIWSEFSKKIELQAIISSFERTIDFTSRNLNYSNSDAPKEL